jgi:hypothetical protein
MNFSLWNLSHGWMFVHEIYHMIESDHTKISQMNENYHMKMYHMNVQVKVHGWKLWHENLWHEWKLMYHMNESYDMKMYDMKIYDMNESFHMKIKVSHEWKLWHENWWHGWKFPHENKCITWMKVMTWKWNWQDGWQKVQMDENSQHESSRWDNKITSMDHNKKPYLIN